MQTTCKHESFHVNPTTIAARSGVEQWPILMGAVTTVGPSPGSGTRLRTASFRPADFHGIGHKELLARAIRDKCEDVVNATKLGPVCATGIAVVSILRSGLSASTATETSNSRDRLEPQKRWGGTWCRRYIAMGDEGASAQPYPPMSARVAGIGPLATPVSRRADP